MFSDVMKGGGPIGWLIAFVMFMVFLYWLSSLSGVSPITNSTISNSLGCNTCGPGGTAGGAYTFIKPFGIVFYASLPLLIAYSFVKRRGDLDDDDMLSGEEE